MDRKLNLGFFSYYVNFLLISFGERPLFHFKRKEKKHNNMTLNAMRMFDTMQVISYQTWSRLYMMLKISSQNKCIFSCLPRKKNETCMYICSYPQKKCISSTMYTPK
jgi:hypothetical protein